MSATPEKIRRARKPDFFQHLSSTDLEKLEAFAREPGSTNAKVRDWILALGVKASSGAVNRWYRNFRESDRQIGASELADAIYSASKDAGAVDIAGAVNLQIAQRLQTALVKGGDKIGFADLVKASMAVNQISTAQKRLNEMVRLGNAELDKLKGESAKRGITPEDIEQVRKAVFG